MAYQHIAASASAKAAADDFRTAAVSVQLKNIMSENEINAYNVCSFAENDDHPVRFCHYYSSEKNCFIQSAVSLESGRSGKFFSAAHTLVLSGLDTKQLLFEHIRPFNTEMFSNTGINGMKRPEDRQLPEREYVFQPCDERETITRFISGLFKGDAFARFLLAILLSADDGKPIYVSLPGASREASLNAAELINIIVPAFPTEYRKKIGFMTNIADTEKYDGIMIYFIDSRNIIKFTEEDAYIFLLSGRAPRIKGPDNGILKENHDIVKSLMTNVLSYDDPALVECLNDIMPCVDEKDRFSPSNLREIYSMQHFMSGNAGDNITPETAAECMKTFLRFYDMSESKTTFFNHLNRYWEKEVEKCRNGGYEPDMRIFDAIDTHFSSFGDEEKRQLKRIWSFMAIYTVTGGNAEFPNKIFSPDHAESELSAGIFVYTVRTFIAFLCRKADDPKTAAVYTAIIHGYVQSVSADKNKLFGVLAGLIRATDQYYEEMSLDRKDQYEIFSAGLIGCVRDDIAARFADAGFDKKFVFIDEMKERLCPDPKSGGKKVYSSPLGRAVFEYFRSSCFIPGIASCFTKEMVSKFADDRKQLIDISKKIQELPELGNIESVSLFTRYCGIISGRRDASVFFELDELVNKPEQQETVKSWMNIYCKKFPEIMLELFANMTCRLDSSGSIKHDIDYFAAYVAYYENSGSDDESMIRDLNRFIGDMESDCTKAEYKELGLAAFREPTSRFVNSYFFDRSADKKRAKENEALLKRYDKVKAIRTLSDGKDKKHGLFGKNKAV